MKPKDQTYGSRFLYAEDLLIGGEFKTVHLTISEFHPAGSLRSADKRLIDKNSIGFDGKSKLLVLCKTNEGVIHYTTGEPPGMKWIGHKVTLQPRVVEAFGDQVVALRIIPPPGTKVRKSILQRIGTKAEWTGNAQKAVPQPRKEETEAGRLSQRIADVDGTDPDRVEDMKFAIESAREQGHITETEEWGLIDQLNTRVSAVNQPDEIPY